MQETGSEFNKTIMPTSTVATTNHWIGRSYYSSKNRVVISGLRCNAGWANHYSCWVNGDAKGDGAHGCPTQLFRYALGPKIEGKNYGFAC